MPKVILDAFWCICKVGVVVVAENPQKNNEIHRNPSKSLPELENSLQSQNIDFGQIWDFYSVSKRRNGVLSIHNHKTYFLKQFSKRLRAIPRLYDQFSMKNQLWRGPAYVDP